jgi:hypothetical protein
MKFNLYLILKSIMLLLKELIESIFSSLIVLVKKPFIAIPFLILLIIQLVSEVFFYKVNNSIISSSQTIHYLWLAGYYLIAFLIYSFIIVFTIKLSINSLKGKLEIKASLNKTVRYFIKNVFILVIIILVYIILTRYIDFYLAFFIGKNLSLSTQFASNLYQVLYYSSIIFILSFFMFTSFFLVYNEKSILNSLKSSFRFVYKNFPLCIIAFLLMVGLYDLSSLANVLILDVITLSELIKYVIIYPLTAILFSKLILNKT